MFGVVLVGVALYATHLFTRARRGSLALTRRADVSAEAAVTYLMRIVGPSRLLVLEGALMADPLPRVQHACLNFFDLSPDARRLLLLLASPDVVLTEVLAPLILAIGAVGDISSVAWLFAYALTAALLRVGKAWPTVSAEQSTLDARWDRTKIAYGDMLLLFCSKIDSDLQLDIVEALLSADMLPASMTAVQRLDHAVMISLKKPVAMINERVRGGGHATASSSSQIADAMRQIPVGRK